MEFRPTQTSPQHLDAYSGLFQQCFPNASGLSPAYLKWLYVDNPEGGVVGFDAWEGDALAAHYVCIPAAASVNGQASRVLLSLNTATHPDFQGKGLFTKLADATYQRGADEGFRGVYGVANANSTPGFIRKLGFELVRPLDALIGFGNIDSDRSTDSDRTSFRRVWDSRSVAWRISNPVRRYRLVGASGDIVGAQASTGKFGLVAWSELPRDAVGQLEIGRSSPALRLHLGLRPKNQSRSGVWFDIPQRFRPSPLNLIYRGLSASESIDKDMVTLGQLDFDAF